MAGTTIQENSSECAPAISWIAAARWIRDHHSARLIHLPTGKLVSKEKDRIAFDEISSVTENEEEYVEWIAQRYSTPKKSDCLMIDAQTANMLCTVYDALGEINKVRFDGMDIRLAIDGGWKMVNHAT